MKISGRGGVGWGRKSRSWTRATSAGLAANTIGREGGRGVNELKCAEIGVRVGLVRTGELADKAGLTIGAIIGNVDRQEKAGWAKGLPDPDDRCRIIIKPGPQDSEVMPGLCEGHMQLMNELLKRYADRDVLLIRTPLGHSIYI